MERMGMTWDLLNCALPHISEDMVEYNDRSGFCMFVE